MFQIPVRLCQGCLFYFCLTHGSICEERDACEFINRLASRKIDT